ncbi:hypothetical protein BH23VER1_BH23VER1_28560 [soil metagenome]
MIVKELRQGMRTRLFSSIFIVLQGVLALALLASTFAIGSASGAAGVGEAVSGLFWWILVIMLLLIMPQRGFSALWSEEKARTLDLVLISRLTSWRIAFGKWAALVCQSALLVTAVLPYIVLRYFLGGSNPIIDLAWVGILFLLSCVFTAVAVGFSGHRFFLIRGAVSIGLILFAFSLSGVLYGMYFDRGALVFSDSASPWWSAAGALTLGVFASYYALDMGAALIAPAAENHATRKRIAGLAMLAVLLASLAFGADVDLVVPILCVVGVIVCLDAITETPNILPSILAPFARKGVLGRVAGRFLCPGWHTGVLYMLLFVGISLASIYQFVPAMRANDDIESYAVLIGLIGSIIFPLALIQLFFPRAPQIFAVYMLAQCSVALYVLLVTIMAEATEHDTIYYFSSFLPLGLLLSHDAVSQLGRPFVLVGSAATLASFIILVIRAIPIFNKSRQVERATLARDSAPTDLAPGHPAEPEPAEVSP